MNRSFDVLTSLLFQAAMPSVALIAIGLAWFAWSRRLAVIPSTLLSLGLGLVVVLLLGVLTVTTSLFPVLGQSLLLLMGIPLLVYAVTLAVLAWRFRIAMLRAVACGLLGLVPLYYMGGFVLIMSVCSFGSGGC